MKMSELVSPESVSMHFKKEPHRYWRTRRTSDLGDLAHLEVFWINDNDSAGHSERYTRNIK